MSATLFRRHMVTGNFPAKIRKFKYLHPSAPACQEKLTNALTTNMTAKCRQVHSGAG